MATTEKTFDNLILQIHWSELNKIWCEGLLDGCLQAVQNGNLIEQKIWQPGAELIFSFYVYRK